jgi:hypothetical protein
MSNPCRKHPNALNDGDCIDCLRESLDRSQLACMNLIHQNVELTTALSASHKVFAVEIGQLQGLITAQQKDIEGRKERALWTALNPHALEDAVIEELRSNMRQIQTLNRDNGMCMSEAIEALTVASLPQEQS